MGICGTPGSPGRSLSHTQYPSSTICGSRKRSHELSAYALIAIRAAVPRARRRPTSNAGYAIIDQASGTRTGTPNTCGDRASVYS